MIRRSSGGSLLVCRAVKCKSCGKTTWAGCGLHVEQVLASVPPAQRCPGHPKAAPARKTPAAPERKSLRDRLFSRR